MAFLTPVPLRPQRISLGSPSTPPVIRVRAEASSSVGSRYLSKPHHDPQKRVLKPSRRFLFRRRQPSDAGQSVSATSSANKRLRTRVARSHRDTIVDHFQAGTHALRVVDESSHRPLHPVLQLLKYRAASIGRRRAGHVVDEDRFMRDGKRPKLALCIEGGGMRGAVSAGMCAAIKYCGLEDCFDAVYGCSAGAIVGAYFVSRQLPLYGAQIYYDVLCGPMRTVSSISAPAESILRSATSLEDLSDRHPSVTNRHISRSSSAPTLSKVASTLSESAAHGSFIDFRALMHHPYFRRLFGARPTTFYSEESRPVLHLDHLLNSVVREQRPLDWSALWRNHQRQPLRPVAASLTTLSSHVLQFTALDELLDCLRASARVPGIAGDPVQIGGDDYCDGLLFESIPFRSAIADGCTHVLVLRTKPDASLTKLPLRAGVYEKHIAFPYFKLHSRCSAAVADYIFRGGHLELYRDDVAKLIFENNFPSQSGPSVCSVVPFSTKPEVRQLESRPSTIFDGVRNGFAAAYEVLSPFATSSVDLLAGEQLFAGDRIARFVFRDEEISSVLRRKKQERREYRRQRREYRRGLRAKHTSLSPEKRFFL